MIENTELNRWSLIRRAEKNHLLYLKQKELLETFLEKGAISQAQYEKSLHDLTEKMGEEGSYCYQ